jgi:hypothetical protein
MKKPLNDCDLYKQPDDVIKEYEDRAFVEMMLNNLIPCCGGHPGEGKHKKLFYRTACEMYEADKREKEKPRRLKKKSDKSK